MRIVKTYEDRKNEILDTAQTLFYKNGYQNTSIANVIDAVNIAKGTFYHYFKSKSDLLDQIINRIAVDMDKIIIKVLEEPEENAIIELNNIYHEVGQYKAQEKDVLLMMTKAIYSEDNIILKTKLYKTRYITIAPWLARVIQRGIDEGLFQTDKPEYIAAMILNMATPLGETFAEYVMKNQLNNENKVKYIEMCKTYNRSVEKILGAPRGSLHLFDQEVIATFFEK